MGVGWRGDDCSGRGLGGAGLSSVRAAAWETGRLALVPEAWRGKVSAAYQRELSKLERIPMGLGKRTKAEQAANGWLTEVSAIFEKVRFAPGLTEGDIRDKAKQCAAEAMSLVEIAPGVFVPGVEKLRVRLEGYARTYGVNPPGVHVLDRPAISRMTCQIWWRRALRVAQARQLEHGAIALSYVHKRADIYASNATVARRAEQRRRNAAILENTKARNLDTGDEYTLAQLSALSVANPAIRRGELMARINGFESVAKGLGHIAEFVTLTCPSRFHRMRKASNGYIEQNPKHDGSSPRDAQKYLVGVWAKMRAKFARIGLRVYGFRIAEPHHDACPHWHLILFMPRFLVDAVKTKPVFRDVFSRYALKDSGDEEGAKKYRTKFESIDWNRGTAAGYVLKYVAKNIDGNGYEVQGDFESGAAIYPAQRVEAWASTWGIRQFQQIGGPPVGVWRELRRMREETEGGPVVLEAARSAADVGNWGRFVEVMGGPVVKRSALPLRAAYTEPGERINASTGEIIKGKRTAYGEDAPGVVYGLRYWERIERRDGLCVMLETVQRVAVSVRYQWEILRGGDAGSGEGISIGGGAGGFGGGMGRVLGIGGGPVVDLGGNDECKVSEAKFSGLFKNAAAQSIKGTAFGVGASGSGDVAVLVGVAGLGVGAACPTRTRVNNCTREKPGEYAGPFCMVDFAWIADMKLEKGGGVGLG